MNREIGSHMDGQNIKIDHLCPHRANSNVMDGKLFRKLVLHLKRTGRYPPVIVRPIQDGDGDGVYQIIDGHHRVEALKQIGHTEVRCVVWDVDDEESLILLATLNQLRGQPNVHLRAELVSELSSRIDLKELARQLPETVQELEKLLAVRLPPPVPRAPARLEDMPVSVHFFLLPSQRNRLEKCLKALGGNREDALMSLLDRVIGESP